MDGHRNSGSEARALLRQSLIDVNRIGVRRIVEGCLAEMDPAALGDELIAPVLTEMGNAWERGEVSLAQIYMAGLVAEEVVSQVIRIDPRARAQPAIAVSVLDDHHLLGKSIVNAVVQASGFITSDFGSMDAELLAERVGEEGIDILMISTLMLRSALQVERLRNALDRHGLSPYLVVGGAPFRFDPDLWRRVGADATGSNAASAIAILNAYCRRSAP